MEQMGVQCKAKILYTRHVACGMWYASCDMRMHTRHAASLSDSTFLRKAKVPVCSFAFMFAFMFAFAFAPIGRWIDALVVFIFTFVFASGHIGSITMNLHDFPISVVFAFAFVNRTP